jgi:hypothetical protein
MVLRAASLVALALLAGCASLDRAECDAGDWRAIGLADGAEGYGPERLDEHRAACARYDVAPDAAAWEAGRQAGLLSYCTPANVYRIGAQGAALSNQCPAESMAELQAAWHQGNLRFAIESEIDAIRSQASYPGYYGPWYGAGYWGAWGPWGPWGDGWIVDRARISTLEAQLRTLPPPPEETATE